MVRIFPKAKSFKRQAVTVVVLLLLFSAYYALVIPAQSRYFTNRYFRLLASASVHLKDIIRNLDSALANATTTGKRAPSPELRTGQIRDAVALIPYLTQTEVTLTNQAPPAGLRLRVATDSPTPALELDYRTNDVRIVARTELSRMIEPFVSRGEFDDVLLVGTNGEVFYQLSASALLVSRLAVPTDKSFETNLVNFAGSDYRLFAQPLRIPTASATGAEATAEWVLCGLVRADHFRQRAWAMDYRVMAVFMFGTMLLVVSWPFLNVWGGGLIGGLRVGERFLLVLSALLVTAVLTLFALDLYAYRSVKQQVDQQLENLAANISSNLESELDQVSKQLSRLNEKLSGFGTDPARTNRSNLLNDPRLMDPAADPYPWLRMVFWADTNGQQTAKWTVKSRNTPFIPVRSRAYFRNVVEGRALTRRVEGRPIRFSLEPIYSVNTGENLAIYATPATSQTTWVSALDLRLLSLVNPVVAAGYGFAVIDAEGKVLFHADERRNLRENFFVECGNDVELRAAVYGRTARPLNASYFRIPHRLFVTPLKDLPWSLVVFREEERMQVAQIEIVSVAGLLFLIYTGLLLASFGVLYFVGGPQRFRWLWPQRKAVETYWLLAQLHFVMAMIAGIVGLLNPEPWLTLLIALAAPVAGLILTRIALDRNWRSPGKLNLPAFLSRGNTNPERLRRHYRQGYVAAMGMLLVLLTVSPTLAFFRIALDKEAELVIKQTQLKLAADLQARTDRIRMEVTGGKGPDGAELPPLVVPDAQAFILRRLTNQWDVYYDFKYSRDVQASLLTNRAPARLNPRMWFNEVLWRVRPHYSKLDVEPGGLLQDAAADGSWQWRREPPGLVLCKSGFPTTDGGVGTLCLRSRLPHLPLPGLAWLAAFVLLLSVPFFMVRTVAERVLLLREDELPASHREWPPGKYLLLGPPHSNKREWLTPAYFTALERPTNPPYLFIDLRNSEDRKWLEPERQDALFKDTGLPIVVDHFEYNLTDPQFNRTKFRFLQQFAYDERRSVIVVSNVHPLHFQVAGRDPKEKPQPGSEKQRRVDLMAAFKRLYKEDQFDGQLAPLAPDVTIHRAHAHYRSIWATCSPKEQEILHQMALGRLISSDLPEIRTLLARRLLELSPDLRLMPDEGFRRFILSHYQPEPDADNEENASLWQSAKGPVLTVLLIGAAFFFLTQRTLWDHTIGLVPAFIAGFGALAQVINLIQKQRLKNTPPPEQ